ncbi:phosphate ABC transporter permease PstA [Gloeothece verrucosa]|uniref:Phosphate transport system permease protein PstA n=1 Tax=Gloeothece verrucosa (strain PCC 7822) TaxID=497965 RepID=E0UKZ4_GLOV7|nr:phosphate ABC transporter permease PstA [Gloeothece verrucosa]ADN17624.1 phosphate ABC transporter, inner membrane subunit PstA [Gloeothece verrucosa PCC 7822]
MSKKTANSSENLALKNPFELGYTFFLKNPVNQKIVYGDILLAIVVWTVAISVTAIFLCICADLVIHGLSKLSWQFLLSEPENAGREGGIASILVSTLMLLIICLAVAVPLSLGTAILLAEYTSKNHWFGRWLRISLDMLASVPSIVFGLFGNAVFCIILGMGFSILSGGLTLACMILPMLIRSMEEGLRMVPDEYRLGAASLGISRISTLINLLLPAAVPSLIAGLILGIGRASAETAALIYTSGYVDRMPQSWLDSGRALSLHIYDLSMNVSGGDSNAYASALVLMMLLIVIDSLASWIGRQWLNRRLQY